MNLSAPLIDNKILLRRLVDRTIAAAAPTETHADLTIKFDDWQWHQGVALYGIVRAGEYLAEPAYFAFAVEWVARQLEKGAPGKSINTTAPLLAVTHLYELTRDAKYYVLCEDFAHWCLHEAPRLPDRTFEHSCTENRYPGQVWADTLFMGCLFLAKWGKLTHKPLYIEEASRQLIQHYRYLHHEETGLIVHGYDGTVGRQMGAVWGRGNGWFAAATAEILPLIENGAERACIHSFLQQHLAGVIRTQDTSGAWHTVLDRADTYLEMSATAAFVAALRLSAEFEYSGKHYKESYADGLSALASKIDSSGVLTHASAGTPVMATAEDYGRIPYAPTCFSQGLAMLALAG